MLFTEGQVCASKHKTIKEETFVISVSEDWVQTKTHHAGSVKAPNTYKISGRCCQQLNKPNKILNIFLVGTHAQRGNIVAHEYCKRILMTFLVITYKNTLKQIRV